MFSFFPLLPSADFLAFPEKSSFSQVRFVFDLGLYDLQLPLIELFYFPLRNGEEKRIDSPSPSPPRRVPSYALSDFFPAPPPPPPPENYGKVRPSPTTTPF